MGRRLDQIVDSELILIALYAYSHPDVLWPWQVRGEFPKDVRALRQHLERMPIGLHHDLEHAGDLGEFELYNRWFLLANAAEWE